MLKFLLSKIRVCCFILSFFLCNICNSQQVSADKLDSAISCLSQIEQSGNFGENLQEGTMKNLPMGIKRVSDNTEIIIAVSKVEMFKNYSQMSVYARVTIPKQEDPQKSMFLFFGSDQIKISHNGSILSGARLVLLSDVKIPFDSGLELIIKGDFDSKTGEMTSQTYMTIDCLGLKELGISAELIFPKEIFTPLNPSEPMLKSKFQTIVSNWNDIFVKVEIPDFKIPALGEYIFSLKDVTLDFSDVKNEKLPKSYLEKYVNGNQPTLWRGVFAKEVSLTLPPEFSTNSNERIKISSKDLIIDKNGISGVFSAENILSFEAGNASGWNFSVNKFELGIEVGQIKEAGFSGHIGIPLEENPRKISYSAKILGKENYQMKINPVDSLNFDFFSAKAQLLPNSYVSLEVKNGKFIPLAVLHGSMSISSKQESSEIIKLSKVDFRGLKISSEAPYVTVDALGYSGKNTISGIPVSIDTIGVQVSANKLMLVSSIKIALAENMFSVAGCFKISADIIKQENKISLKYATTAIDSIKLDATIAEIIRLKGSLNIMSAHQVYGDGFMGDILLDIKQPINLSVRTRGAFGKKDDFRYWFVEGSAISSVGIPVFPGLSLNGFMGGLSSKMKVDGISQQTSSFHSVKYIPDKNSAFGLKAGVMVSIAEVSALQASFDIMFSESGGINYMGLYGFAQFPKSGNFDIGTNKLTSCLDNILQSEKQVESSKLQYLKASQPSQAAKQINVPQDVKAGISASMGIQFDFENKSMHSTADLYFNTPGNILSGVGAGGRAGYMVLHFDPNTWYLHLGNPSDRMGVKLSLGKIINISTTSYLMAGSQIPEMPPVPSHVSRILNIDPSRLSNRNLQALSTGKGFAFGSDFSVSTGDLTFLIMYANLAAGLGFDIMLKNYGEAQCAGRSGKIGIDGWYAQGQAYSYLQGEFGVNVTLFKKNKRFPILKGGAATLMQAQLPNPSSFKGDVGLNINILGLIKGSAKFSIQLGDECQVLTPGASPVEMEMISDISPSNDQNDVSVFSSVAVAFTTPIEESFNIEDGSKYRIKLQSFVVKDSSGKQLAGEIQYSKDKSTAFFKSHDIFPPQTELKASATVIFENFVNGVWKVVESSTEQAKEEKSIRFTTGTAPNNIPIENIEYTYPVADQKFFLLGESGNGEVQLKKGQSYLFPKAFNYKIVFEGSDGQNLETPLQYDSIRRSLKFSIPNLKHKTSYKMRVTFTSSDDPNIEIPFNKPSTKNIGSADGNDISIDKKIAVAEKNDVSADILKYSFSTSKYRTFAEKVNSIVSSKKNYSEQTQEMKIRFLFEVNSDEKFDEAEIFGLPQSANKPLMLAMATFDEPYYTKIAIPQVYQDYPFAGVSLNRNIDQTGLYPKYAVTPLKRYLDDINSKSPTYFFPLAYQVHIAVENDFYDLRTKIANLAINNNSSINNNIYNRFIENSLQFLSTGEYKVNLTYTLPGGKTGTSTTISYKNYLITAK